MHVWPALVTLVVSLASPRWWVPALRRWGAIDVPNARSSHRLPTIRGAGLAPATGVLAGLLMALLLSDADVGLLLCVVLGAALVMSVLGLLEDVRGVPIAVRATVQVGTGLVLSAALCLALDRSLWWVLPIAVAVAGYVNAANFMDGVNGMSAFHGVVAGSYFVVVGFSLDDGSWISVAGLILAAAFVGFAPWNLLRGRVFLGDVGSYLLGSLVVGCGAAVFLLGGSVLVATAPALPYLADTGLTFARRARQRERVYEAHRSHVYQRLTDRGWSHLSSSTAVATASAVCCGAALWTTRDASPVAAAVLLILVVLTGYLTAPRWAVRAKSRLSA